MAVNSCASLGLTYNQDFCLLVDIDKDEDEFTADPGWIVGAAFLGLILGALLVLLLAKPFLNAWEKKKKQDEENLLVGTGKRSNIVEAKAVIGWVDNEGEKTDRKEKKGFFKKAGGFFNRKKSAVKANEKDKTIEKEENEALTRGMADIMVQTNSATIEVEIANQDITRIIQMENGRKEEKDTVMLKLLKILLRKKMEKRAVTENFYVNFMKKTEEEVTDMNKMINRERQEVDDKLQINPKLKKDTQTLEKEMEKQQSHLNNKQNQLQREYKNHIRHDLLRSSGMSEAEVDDLMDKLMKNMAFVEERLGLEQARQRRALEQRLAKRRQAVEFQEAGEKEAEAEVDDKVSSIRFLLNAQVDDNNSMLEKQADEIVLDYANDLENLRTFHASEYGGLTWDKLSILENFRRKSFAQLTKKQEKEKAVVLLMADKKTQIDFIKMYHDLMVKHHMEQEALWGELDQKEVQELYKLKQEMAKNKAKAVDIETEKLAEKLENTTNMTLSEATRLLKLHKQEVANLTKKQQREKQAMMARLNERLQQRLAAADEAEARDQREQEILKDEQIATLTKVLATNMDLTEEAKERVMREHEQNMQAMSNQLLNSKMRQQKSMEVKLNQRRVKLAQLKKEKEELKRAKKMSNEKEKVDTEAKLAADIAMEEKDFENARKEAVAGLRRRLAEETKETLKQQDEEIGLLIGRLQIGQARRKAILGKQDTTLKQLQEELEKKVTSGKEMPASMTDQLIQQHYNRMSHTNENLQRIRNMQEQMIKEKLNQKRSQMEMEIETQLEEEAKLEYTDRQKKGAGYASLALMQSFLEQRHAKAMHELETEMQTELEKGKNDLNTALEQELRKDLEAQRHDLLTELAAVSKMSKGDLQDAVQATTQGRPADKTTQKLARDLRNSVERAKTSMAMDYGDRNQDEPGFRRTNTDISRTQENEFSDRNPRKGSTTGSLRKQPRQAYDVDDDEF